MADSAKSPLVSICIPTYRGADHLATTINSVLAQTETNFELIIIDDNSPDSTHQVVSTFDDPRIRYLRNTKNLGPEGNWNRCLEEANGIYFKLLPQDDTLYPDTIKKQTEVLQQDKAGQIAFVFGARDVINAQDRILMRRGYPGGQEGLIRGSELIRRCVRFGTNLIGEPGCVLLRKNLTDKVGPFDASIPYIIDLDYWTRLLDYGDAYYLDQTVSTFRVSTGSWSVTIGRRQSVEFNNFINKLRGLNNSNIKYTDKIIGHVMASINNYLRLFFYQFTLRKRKVI